MAAYKRSIRSVMLSELPALTGVRERAACTAAADFSNILNLLSCHSSFGVFTGSRSKYEARLSTAPSAKRA
jgi:hypothetical protein